MARTRQNAQPIDGAEALAGASTTIKASSFDFGPSLVTDQDLIPSLSISGLLDKMLGFQRARQC